MRRQLIFMIVTGLSLSLVASACVFRGTRTRELDLGQSFATVTSRAKAHLVDGTTVMYRDGFTLRNDTLYGVGMRYNLALTSSTPVAIVPVDSVVGIESFHTSVHVPATLLGSALGTFLATFGLAALAVAIFRRNNWALPYVRTALEPPVTPDPDAARALALASGSFLYFHARFTRSHPELDVDIVERWLTVARSAVERVVDDQTDPQTRGQRLAGIWRDLCTRLRDDCREPRRKL